MKKAILAMSLLSISVLPVHSLAQTKGEADASGATALSLPTPTQTEKVQVKAMRKAEGITAAQAKGPRGEAEYTSMGAVGAPTAEQRAATTQRRADIVAAVKNHETETDKP